VRRLLDVPAARTARSRPLPGAPLAASANDLSAPLSNFTVASYPLGLSDTQGGGGAVAVHRRNRRLARLAEAREARREGRVYMKRGLDRASEAFARPRTKEAARRWKAREARRTIVVRGGGGGSLEGRAASISTGKDKGQSQKEEEQDEDEDGLAVHIRELLRAEDVIRDIGAPASAVSSRAQSAWGHLDLRRAGVVDSRVERNSIA